MNKNTRGCLEDRVSDQYNKYNCIFNESIGSNVSPSHPPKNLCNTHCSIVFLKAEKSEERNLAKNKTVTTVIQCVCFTCLDFLVLLTIKCTGITVNLKI